MRGSAAPHAARAVCVAAGMAAVGGCAEFEQGLRAYQAELEAQEARAAEEQQAAAEETRGVFHAVGADGSVNVLDLTVRGSKVVGTLGPYAVDAERTGEGGAAGRVLDPATGLAVGEIAISQQSDALVVALTEVDAATGARGASWRVLFVPGAAPPVGASSSSSAASAPAAVYAPAPAPVQAAGELDPRLVGRWLYTYTYVSGDFSVASDTWTVFGEDGSFATWEGGAAGGGSSGTFASGPSDATRGRWRTSGRRLEILHDGASEWRDAGTFGLTDDLQTLRVVSPNGQSRINERR